MHKVTKHSSSNYAWDYPSARDKRLLLNINGKDRAVDIMEIGNLLPFKFPVRVLDLSVLDLKRNQLIYLH